MTRSLAACMLIALSLGVCGQGDRFKPSFNAPFSISKEFLKTQWFLGFKFGGNLSPVGAKNRVHGFSPINYSADDLKKKYNAEWGGHAGIDITFYAKGFSVGIQPNFRRQGYRYLTSYRWGNETKLYTTTQRAEQRLDYLDFPLFVKYDLTKMAMRPFVLAGLYYSILTAAEKSIRISETDSNIDRPVNLGAQRLSIGNKSAFTGNTSGFILGGGVSWDPGNIRIILDFQYRDSFGSITRETARFNENQLASIGDVDDEVSLRNLNISMSFQFPLRFITDDFTSTF